MFDYFQYNHKENLERQDFIRFSSQFKKVIFENIPTLDRVEFLDPPEPQPAADPSESKNQKGLRQSIETAVRKEQIVLYQDQLLLPFNVGDCTVVAKVSGLDKYLIRKIGNDWLGGLPELIVRQFLLVKRACVDPLTGLLSSTLLEHYFDAEGEQTEGILILFTAYPKCSSSFQAKNVQHHTVSLLKSFVDDRFPTYYLGQSCFAIVCEKKDFEFTSDFVPSILNYLKREGCYRVHVASVSYGTELLKKDSSQSPSERVMKKAWTALHIATKRGRFAFCNYSSIDDGTRHPLGKSAVPLVKWSQKVTRNLEKCSLIHFNSSSSLLSKYIKQSADADRNVFVYEQSVYLLLPNKDPKFALKTCQGIIKKINENDKPGIVFNCGISSFPFGNFKKSEMLLNCRKALFHADFLPPGSIIICDAVSCNIAGDIYYADGDLVLAVKEYKGGLLLEPGNGNLLNSLGVCYAQMDNHKMAVDCFSRASESKKDRFMALYNLGLEQQIRDEKKSAIDSLSKALAVPEQDEEGDSRSDICYQLAALKIDCYQFQDGCELMLSWYEAERLPSKKEKALRFLGKACFGLGRFREAIKYLQQAMQFDEYDAEVLGLLGELYLKENEGDDIALRFCEKAVELDPYSLELKLRLAKVQVHCGDFSRAVKSLQPCLRNRKTRPAALLQRGLLAFEQGQKRLAKNWFLKVQSCSNGQKNNELKKIAASYLKEIA